MATPTPVLDDKLKTEYQNLFDTCKINSDNQKEVERIAERMKVSRERYEKVGNALHIPWYFIGAIHNMECSGNFNLHLHNGDLLTARTTHVPKDRPTGNPPFTWEQSAIDALTLKRLHLTTDWSLPCMLYLMEAYNGFGYRVYHKEVNTPYLWSYTDKYENGKYASDGKFDPLLKSKQCGTVAMLKYLEEKKDIPGLQDGFFVAATVPITASNNVPKKGKVSVDSLNIRQAPQPSAEAASRPLMRGTDVEITGEQDGWYQVNVVVKGWVKKDYIS
jgi:lysozyme family protein